MHPRNILTTDQTHAKLPPISQLRQPRGKSLESLEDPSERGNGRTCIGPPLDGHLAFVRPTQSAAVVTAATAADLYYSNNSGSHQSTVVGSLAPAIGFVGGGQYAHGGYHHQTGNNSQQQPPWRRSYDDGDITPTNEMSGIAHNCCDFSQQGGGTLPRHHRGGPPRQRPVAKVMANLPFQAGQIMAGGGGSDVDYANENILMCSAGKVSVRAQARITHNIGFIPQSKIIEREDTPFICFALSLFYLVDSRHFGRNINVNF